MSTITVVSTSEQPKPAEAAKAATPKAEAVETSEATTAEAAPLAEIADESETPETEHEETEETEEAGEEAKAEQPKKKSGFQKRIDKLNKRASQAEQEREYWRNEALKAKPQETKQVEAKKEPGKPVADAYASHDEYVEALTDWKIEQRETAKEMKAKQESEKSALQTKVDTYKASAAALSEKYEDHDDVIEGCEVNVPVPIQQLILDSENGAELSYHLAKNEEELKRICALSPVAAARELGKFEAKHISPSTEALAEEIKTTKAPAPLKPVGSKGSASPTKTIWDADKMSQAEYEALRAKQRAKKRA